MPIKFTCGKEGCGQSIHVPDNAAGKKVRCPKCGSIISVPHHVSKPGEPELLTFDDGPAAPQARPPTGSPSSPASITPAPAKPRIAPSVARPATLGQKSQPVQHVSKPHPIVAPNVPGSAVGKETDTIGFADEPPVRNSSGGSPPPVDTPAGISYCSRCGRLMREDKTVCPDCGWVRGTPAAGGAAIPGASPRPMPWHKPELLSPSGLAAKCITAFKYGVSNFKSVAVMVLYSLVLIYILRLVLINVLLFLMLVPKGFLLMPLVLIFMYVILSGYYFRFSLDCIVSSIEGTDLAPDPPAFNFGSLWTTGWRAAGIALVYVFPVVTIPLLPLALLALGYSNDNRCFSVSWAFRAAIKRPGHLAMLWLVLLLWLVAMTVGLFIASVLRDFMIVAVSSSAGWLVAFMVSVPANLLISVIFYVFVAVIFRCIGLLGRSCPDLIDMLPEQISTGATAGYVSAGLAASVLVFTATAVLLAVILGNTVWDRLALVTASGQYGTTNATDASLMRLDGVSRLISTYTLDATHLGQFPRSLKELEDKSSDKTIFESPGKKGVKFVYIPGQYWSEKTENNILVYDPIEYYDPETKSKVINVLLVNGEIESIPAKDLIKRLADGMAATSRPVFGESGGNNPDSTPFMIPPQ